MSFLAAPSWTHVCGRCPGYCACEDELSASAHHSVVGDSHGPCRCEDAMASSNQASWQGTACQRKLRLIRERFLKTFILRAGPHFKEVLAPETSHSRGSKLCPRTWRVRPNASVLVLAPVLVNCVTSDESLNLSGPQFPFCKLEIRLFEG